MNFGHGYFPIQCDCCGRELINMGCNACSRSERFVSPPEIQPTAGPPTGVAQLETHLAQRLAEKNRGGFPKFSQLSPMPPSTSVPTSPVRPRSPRKKAYIFTPPIREIQFRGINGMPLKLSDGMSTTGPPVVDGHHRPFAKRMREGQQFTVLTKFEWAYHKWETTDLPCHRDTTETALFRCLCIHFLRFVKAMEKCSNSQACLCGGPNSSVAETDAKVLGYDLFHINESFTIMVKTGTTV